MSVITNNTIQPSSGQALTIKDEGGDASITVATNGEATFAENIKITANKGINFSAYATSGNPSSNLLDDYEIGSFDITKYNGDSPNIDYNNATCSYIKIGRSVTISVLLPVTTGNSINIPNYVGLSGLPFTVASDGRGTGRSSTDDIDLNRGGELSATSNQVYLGPQGAASGCSSIMFSLTYFTS